MPSDWRPIGWFIFSFTWLYILLSPDAIWIIFSPFFPYIAVVLLQSNLTGFYFICSAPSVNTNVSWFFTYNNAVVKLASFINNDKKLILQLSNRLWSWLVDWSVCIYIIGLYTTFSTYSYMIGKKNSVCRFPNYQPQGYLQIRYMRFDPLSFILSMQLTQIQVITMTLTDVSA